MFAEVTGYDIAEWIATGLSLVGFFYCILKRPSCFVWFLIGDLAWFATAILCQHYSLIAQQIAYIVMNVAGYYLWRKEVREEKLRVEREKEMKMQIYLLQLALRHARSKQPRRQLISK